MKMITRINRTVFELWVGIITFGILCQIVCIWMPDKGKYSLCLWSGIAAALVCAFHMWWSLERELGNSEDKATKNLKLQFTLRYIFLIIVLGITGYFCGNYVLATFAGIMGTKIAAYLEPCTKKISTLIYGEEILPERIENLDEYEKQQKLLSKQEEGGE